MVLTVVRSAKKDFPFKQADKVYHISDVPRPLICDGTVYILVKKHCITNLAFLTNKQGLSHLIFSKKDLPLRKLCFMSIVIL